MEQGLYSPDTGTVKSGDQEFSLLEAVDQGLVDKDSIIITDPNTGESMSLDEAADKGLLNTQTGEVVDPASGRSMTFGESLKRGLLAAAVAPIAAPILLKQKVEEYLENKNSGQAKEASDDTEDDITVTDPVTGKDIPIDDAVKAGIIDEKTGNYIDTQTGESLTFQEAINEGLIASASQPGVSDEMTRPEDTTKDHARSSTKKDEPVGKDTDKKGKYNSHTLFFI